MTQVKRNTLYALQFLNAKLGQQVLLPCPECGAAGPHDSNGDRHDPSFCCAACGAHSDCADAIMNAQEGDSNAR